MTTGDIIMLTIGIGLIPVVIDTIVKIRHPDDNDQEGDKRIFSYQGRAAASGTSPFCAPGRGLPSPSGTTSWPSGSAIARTTTPALSPL